ncbi:MAG: ATP-dependent metallopeptidase FtsH/Yme1/Tma family protein, partial [Thermodesulfovibrionaceae bacterium]
MNGQTKGSLKALLVWLVIGISIIVLFNLFSVSTKTEKEIMFSEFLVKLQQNQIEEVTIKDHSIVGKLKDGTLFKTYYINYPELVKELSSHGVKITVKPPEQTPWYINFLVSWGPVIFLVFLWILFMKQMQAGSTRAMSFGKARAKMVSNKSIKITFADVAGIEEVKEEVKERVDFLTNPQKYIKLGAKIPKGILLVGPPGTGQTRLAKALAGEAGVPFFSRAGGDVVARGVGGGGCGGRGGGGP